MSRKRSAVPWVAVLGTLVLAPAAPTHALRVLLDHDTDGRDVCTARNACTADAKGEGR